ncbi:hypothetical protein T12_7316 [Trichinella patagoniensis]|uniref:Uncharacterized protein n=1 Tax=Trichinella patagoniensis TaxID=990121 RepID=A0A0V0ZQJ3_9BILA|nr:hypothetical protein T12_7316 [Trichinella patagoniensis]
MEISTGIRSFYTSRKNHSRGTVVQLLIGLEEEMFLSNGNRFKYFAIACHLELVIIKCVINFFHLSGACFVVVLGLADAGLPACVFIRFGSAISVLLCSFRLLLHVRNYCQLNSLFRLFCFFGMIDAHQAERIWLCVLFGSRFLASLFLILFLYRLMEQLLTGACLSALQRRFSLLHLASQLAS